MEHPELLIILVCYFNEKEIYRFVRKQLVVQEGANFRIIIVNNGTRQLSELTVLQQEFPWIEIIGEGINRGYMGAASFALKQYMKSASPLQGIVILCNADLEFSATDALFKMANESSDYDVAGPDLESTRNKKHLNPFSVLRFTKSKLLFLRTIYSFYPLYLMYQFLSVMKRIFSKRYPANQAEEASYIYAVHGSFMIFKHTFFEKGGSFDYGGFLFGEEIFIAEQCRKYNMKVKYLPSVHLYHYEHSTTGLYKSPRHIRWMKDSLSWLISEYYHG